MTDHYAEVSRDLERDVDEFANAVCDCTESTTVRKALHDLVYGQDMLDAAGRLRLALIPILGSYAEREAELRSSLSYPVEKPRAYELARKDFIDTVGQMFQPVDRARKAGM